MAAIPLQVVVDCPDPATLAAFWAAALHYTVEPGTSPDAAAVVDPAGVGPRVYLQRVPEPKAVKNRVHLDLKVVGWIDVDDTERARRLAVESARLVALGATELRDVRENGEHWIVMADPAGNEFCLC